MEKKITSVLTLFMLLFNTQINYAQNINELSEDERIRLIKYYQTIGEPMPGYLSNEQEQGTQVNVTKSDIHSNNFEIVTIGKQSWMAKNLGVSTFRNGDPIPQAKSDAEWAAAGENRQPAWCYYDNDPANGAKYGKLYNWYAVNDPRGLAPEGWKIPSVEDWTRLIDFLGGESVAEKKMKSAEIWVDYYGKSGNGTNESGFSGLPGGFRNYIGYGSGYSDPLFSGEANQFKKIYRYGYWWSSTEIGHVRESKLARSLIICSGQGVSIDFNNKKVGMSVRCLRD